MESHHASRGRRTLEEIRQKRAAERMQQQVMSNSYGGYPVGTSNEQALAMEKEIQDLQAQLKQESMLKQHEQQKQDLQAQLKG